MFFLVLFRFENSWLFVFNSSHCF